MPLQSSPTPIRLSSGVGSATPVCLSSGVSSPTLICLSSGVGSPTPVCRAALGRRQDSGKIGRRPRGGGGGASRPPARRLTACELCRHWWADIGELRRRFSNREQILAYGRPIPPARLFRRVGGAACCSATSRPGRPFRLPPAEEAAPTRICSESIKPSASGGGSLDGLHEATEQAPQAPRRRPASTACVDGLRRPPASTACVDRQRRRPASTASVAVGGLRRCVPACVWPIRPRVPSARAVHEAGSRKLSAACQPARPVSPRRPLRSRPLRPSASALVLCARRPPSCAAALLGCR